MSSAIRQGKWVGNATAQNALRGQSALSIDAGDLTRASLPLRWLRRIR
jgi:hypothetical protein